MNWLKKVQLWLSQKKTERALRHELPLHYKIWNVFVDIRTFVREYWWLILLSAAAISSAVYISDQLKRLSDKYIDNLITQHAATEEPATEAPSNIVLIGNHVSVVCRMSDGSESRYWASGDSPTTLECGESGGIFTFSEGAPNLNCKNEDGTMFCEDFGVLYGVTSQSCPIPDPRFGVFSVSDWCNDEPLATAETVGPAPTNLIETPDPDGLCIPQETDGVGGLEFYRATQPTLIIATWSDHFGGHRVPIVLATGEAVTFLNREIGSTVDVLNFCEPNGPQIYLSSPTTTGIETSITNEDMIKEDLIKIEK